MMLRLSSATTFDVFFDFMVWPAVRRQVDPLRNASFGLEPGRGLGLTPETLQRLLVLGYVYRKELQSDKTVKSCVLSLGLR